MFETQGPLAPGSRLFVGRAAELNKMEAWLTHVHCAGAVLGGRQTGKTSLLLKLLHTHRAKYAFAFVNFQDIEGADVGGCFSYIAEEMIRQWNGGGGAFLDRPLPKDSRTFLAFLQQFSEKVESIRIVIILDEVGALPPQTAIKLAHTIRAAFTNRFITPEYGRYVFILAGAVEMLQLATSRNSPLNNISDSIYLSDLSLAETGQLLAEGFGAPIQPSAAINQHIYDWTGGHPYWTQVLAAILAGQDQAVSEEVIRDAVEQLLQMEDKNLPHVFRLLHSETLWPDVERVLKGSRVSFSRSHTPVAKLELIGIIKNRDGYCDIRNKLYREATQRYLDKPDKIVIPLPDYRSQLRHYLEQKDGQRATLTVLFTDIEGSTEQTERYGDSFWDELRSHHNAMSLPIVRAEGAGFHVKSIGDALMVVFDSASAAVRAALSLQAAFREFNQVNKGKPDLRVRIGIHCGEVTIENLDVYGTTVNIAARVVGLAAGRQIYMTQRVRDDARSVLREEHLTWTNHGPYQLKGISEPHEVWEVIDSRYGQPAPPRISQTTDHSQAGNH